MDLIGTDPFVWLPIHQQPFEEMKALLVADTLMHIYLQVATNHSLHVPPVPYA